jgi:hypothetical protein
MSIRPHALLLCLLSFCSVPPAAARPMAATDWGKDLEALQAGAREIGIPGLPGTLSVVGEDAFPVLCAPSGGRPTPVVGAARFGRGRVLALAHNGWFGDVLSQADTTRFLANVCHWAAGRAKEPRVVVARWDKLSTALAGEGLSVDFRPAGDWEAAIGDADVLCLATADVTDAQLAALRTFVRRGGGLVCGLPGWGWQQLNPGKNLATENPVNRLLAEAGLVWGSDTISKPASGRLVVAPPPALAHSGLALAALTRQAEGRGALSKEESALAVATVTRAIRDVPPDDKHLLPRLDRLLRQSDDPRNLPSAQKPLTDASGLGKMLLTMQIRRNRELPVEKVKAHPAAALFPGAVPRSAQLVTRQVLVDLAVPEWQGTGLYAVPGKPVRVRLPAEATALGLGLRIGAHKDLLWGKAAWRRVPEITRVFPLRTTSSVGVNAFGGPIYIVVPRGAAARTVQVEIEGAVEAPRFVLGETDPEAWRRSIRTHPAPWAELEARNVILTLPSEVIRGLDDPVPLLRFWDRVLDADADLTTIPRARARPERFVTDEQISVGYMHSGYPIMTHLDAAPRFVDLKTLSTKGDWGMFHELGHNHQQRDWTFSGTVEVTCNLYSLYVLETVCSAGKLHEAMTLESRQRAMALHRTGRRSFEMWKQKPFLALAMYFQLQQAFGWDAFKKVFAVYRDLPAGERPRTDAEKRDQWMVRFSRAIERDLGPFFEAWGVPTSVEARASISSLPPWMPPDMK